MNDLDPQAVIVRGGPTASFEDPADFGSAPATQPSAVVRHRQRPFYGNVGPLKASAPIASSAHLATGPTVPVTAKRYLTRGEQWAAIATTAALGFGASTALWGALFMGWIS